MILPEKSQDQQRPSRSGSLCKKCRTHRRRTLYQFCSKACRRQCSIPACKERSEDGSPYCTQLHRKAAVQIGIAKPCKRCGILPREKDSRFCSTTCSSELTVVKSPPLSSPIRRVTSKRHTRSTRSRRPPDDKCIVPQPPKHSVEPRSPYQISFGEYRGQPNFLVRSKKGIEGYNLPGDLRRIVERKNAAEGVLDFSLGPEGKFYLLWRNGSDLKIESSSGLWEELNIDFQGTSVKQIQFGGGGTVWGIRSFVQSNTLYEARFGRIPRSLAETLSSLRSEKVDFAAVGMSGSWIIGPSGKPVQWDRIEGSLGEKLMKEKCNLKNVVIAPTTTAIYVLETKDGTIQYRVPDEWQAKLKIHLVSSSNIHRTPTRLKKYHSEPKFQAPTKPGSALLAGGKSQGASFRPNPSLPYLPQQSPIINQLIAYPSKVYERVSPPSIPFHRPNPRPNGDCDGQKCCSCCCGCASDRFEHRQSISLDQRFAEAVVKGAASGLFGATLQVCCGAGLSGCTIM